MLIKLFMFTCFKTLNTIFSVSEKVHLYCICTKVFLHFMYSAVSSDGDIFICTYASFRVRHDDVYISIAVAGDGRRHTGHADKKKYPLQCLADNSSMVEINFVIRYMSFHRLY